MEFKSIFILCLVFASSLSSPFTKELNRTVAATDVDLSCPAYGQDCIFNDIERAYDSGTWQECAYQCNQHRTCVFWSWRTQDSAINPYGCWLKSACPLILADPALISGHFDCY
ncbi:uncharacterized protein LOC111709853 [Eurytemora carolleeae]|uniref:uncharacterized protein LOC111709853 n=1 Tax=Eurytemora carolleeae TaxID=1294199 RepID=UPI000C75F6AE|nr:uncharacterized protein LOC111709853 [Eurytemora carolleeae]|eukprot:XP_023339540.1 uncharacterized protein LOC111709853 [Eurytemora affinis]